MAKFSGIIGFMTYNEVTPGVWEEVIIPRHYHGDVIKLTRQSEHGEGLNDNLTINNQISIVADAFAKQNLQALRYVEWMGARWKVTSVDIQPPRLILQIGGVYNGKQA